MERKAIHALLLSLAVVAGGVMMTTDAHAQTNTERLITAVDNTNSIMDALAELADAVTNGFASVLAALGMVQADTETIMAELGHVEGDLQAISSDLTDVNSNIQSVQNDVAGLSGGLSDVNSNLQNVQNDLDELAGTVGGSAVSFTSLADTVNKNAVAINEISEQLESISMALGAVNQTASAVKEAVEAPPSTTEVPDTGLMKGKTTYAVKLQDFGDSVPQGEAPDNNTYEVTHSLVCGADVSLDDARVTVPIAPLGGTAGTTANAPADVSVSVGVDALYTTHFVANEAAPTTITILHNTKDLDLETLSAGSALVFRSVTTVGDTANAFGLTDPAPDTPFSINDYVNTGFGKNITVADTEDDAITRADAGDVTLYTITVNWLAGAGDPECTITSSSVTSSGLTQVGETVLVPLTVSGDGILKPYSETVDCGHQETVVNAVRIEGVVVLPEHASMTLEAGGETEKLELTVDKNGVITASNIGFKFNNDDLTVKGSLTGSAVAQLTYDTIDNNECVVPDA